MKAALKWPLLITLIAMLPTLLQGETPDADVLKGLKGVEIVIEGFKAPQCGVSADDLKTSVDFILGQSSLSTRGITPFFLDVRVTFLPDCRASIVELGVFTTTEIITTKEMAFARIWSWGTFITGDDQRSRALAQLETGCKKLVVDWNSVNKSQ